jgi:hypothetical protein
MSGRIAGLACLLCLILGAFAADAAAPTAQELVGTWKLISSRYEQLDTGKTGDNLGAHPSGVLIITPEHRFTVVMVGEGRQPGETPEAANLLMHSMLAYSGPFTIEPDPQNPDGVKLVAKIDVSWNQSYTGTDQLRLITLDGNRITIKTAAIISPVTGQRQIATLVWERSQ